MLLEVADRFVKFLCGMDNQGVVPPGLHSPAAASPGGGGTAGGDRRRDGGSGQDKDPRAGFPQASGFVPVSSKLNLNVNLTKPPNEVSATKPFKHGDSMSPRRTLIFQNVGMKSKKCHDGSGPRSSHLLCLPRRRPEVAGVWRARARRRRVGARGDNQPLKRRIDAVRLLPASRAVRRTSRAVHRSHNQRRKEKSLLFKSFNKLQIDQTPPKRSFSHYTFRTRRFHVAKTKLDFPKCGYEIKKIS